MSYLATILFTIIGLHIIAASTVEHDGSYGSTIVIVSVILVFFILVIMILNVIPDMTLLINGETVIEFGEEK